MLAAGFVIAAVATAVVVVCLQVFVAERIPALTETRLDQAESLWERTGLHNYDMELKLQGAQPGTVEVQVRAGKVTAQTRDGRTPPTRTWDYWSVPGLFETLARDMELAADPVHETGAEAGTQWRLRCEFDPQFGYPRRYHRFVSGGGPEVSWRVTRFVPR
jgi:hypothetical protein